MKALVPVEIIEKKIILIRGEKVIPDADLAELYGVETKMLVRAVKRNMDRFPADFMFQLTKDEFENLRIQIGTSSRWGGRRYLPYVFTEQGVAMLSSVLQSERAVKVNIAIMRTFVKLRQMGRRKLPWAFSEHGEIIALTEPPGRDGARRVVLTTGSL